LRYKAGGFIEKLSRIVAKSIDARKLQMFKVLLELSNRSSKEVFLFSFLFNRLLNDFGRSLKTLADGSLLPLTLLD
jgi:hypothetical protein